MIKKIVLSLFVSVWIVLALTACSSNDETKNVSKVLGVDLSDGTILQSIDSHGGFHGDGDTYIKISFDDNKNKTVVEEIKNTEGWCELSSTDNLNNLVYNFLVTNNNGGSLFPEVDNGYCFFSDRHSESKDVKDDANLFNGKSFNFTIAIYDVDAQILYYHELDT